MSKSRMRKSRMLRCPRGLKRLSVGLVALVGCSGLTGCYTFVEVDPTLAPIGARARAELTSEGSSRVAGALGGDAERRVTGKILEVHPDGGILMEVANGPGDNRIGVSSRPLFSRLSISGGDLLNLELKQLNKGRTAALVGASAAVAAVVVTAAFDIAWNGEGENQGPPVNQILIPLFSFYPGGG